MKIGLYFGSFNPVHTGHLIIANHVAINTDLDQVWLVVSPQNPLKPQKNLLNEYQRKHLIDIAIEGEKKLKCSTVEFNLPKPSYTVDTLAYLKDKHPDYQFVIILGSDSYNNLSNWKNHEILLRDYEILIYKRPGVENIVSKSNKTTILDAPLLEISSTRIRQMIKEKESIRYLVPDIVKEEIERSSYYKIIP
jgi:nicotinate-nucleotide adenylyltransferase